MCVRAPIRPTAQTIAEHEVCHLPFRAWCPYFVRARGASCGHPAAQKGDEQTPTPSCDYGFLGTPEQAATDLPTLVIKGNLSKIMRSRAFARQGIEHPHGSTCPLHALRETGYKRLILKSDRGLLSGPSVERRATPSTVRSSRRRHPRKTTKCRTEKPKPP